MPYLHPAQRELPWQGRSSHAAHAGRSGAEAAAPRAGTKRQELLDYLHAHGPATDEEIECDLGWRRSSVCARRNELVTAGLVESCEVRRIGDSGIRLAVWRAR